MTNSRVNEIIEAIKIQNSFEKALNRSKITPNRELNLTLDINQIPENVDISDILIQMNEDSKRYTHFISDAQYYLTSTGENNIAIQLTVKYYVNNLLNCSSGTISLPFKANICDLIGATFS